MGFAHNAVLGVAALLIAALKNKGIPRLLDAGQCNDACSAIQIAAALADVFGVGVNDLPRSLFDALVFQTTFRPTAESILSPISLTLQTT